MLDLQKITVTRYNEVRDKIGQTVTLESVVEEIRNPRPDVLTVLQRIKSVLKFNNGG